MITTRQKLRKLLEALRKIDTQNNKSETYKNLAVVYLENWISDLQDDNN